MGHVELSAELHVIEDNPDTSSNTAPHNAVCAASALLSTADRQQSSNNCRTSGSAPASQHDRRKSRPSSVRSRAAFFEAMIASPPGSSPPDASTQDGASSGSPPRPRELVVNRSTSSPARGSQALVSHVPGQEVEMVQQSGQAPVEVITLNTLAQGFPAPVQSSALPVRALPKREPVSETQPGSSLEIQPQSLELHTAELGSSSAVGSMSPCRHAPAAAVVSSSMPESGAACDDEVEHGIELQEQGHAEMLEHALERLQAELTDRDKQSVAAASALACKTQECESLMRIVRELTESRSKLVYARTNLAERLAEMQHEYMRLMRVADLSRVVSKENVAKTAKVMKTLKQVEDESARQQHLIGYFKERNKNLKDENLELRERVCMLERLDLLSYSRDSVCMREFKLHALKETY